jgi:hypothetical protein
MLYYARYSTVAWFYFADSKNSDKIPNINIFASFFC